MSEEVRDLLLYGVAAARANEREEARSYLEWVITRSDADLDQQMEAWLWLGEICDEPKQKREFLENALAINPLNVQARCSLAIVDGKLNPADIVDQQHPAQTLGATMTTVTVRRYSCPRCGGVTSFDIGQKALQCVYCGSRLEDQPEPKSAVAEERDFLTTLPTAGAHRWVLPAEKALACSGCGAAMTALAGQISATCLFCGSPQVALTPARRDLIQPNGIVPFAFDKNSALSHISGWLHNQRVNASLADALLRLARPIYLPFWTFDIDANLEWSAMTPETQFGRRRTYRRVTGTHYELFDDILTPAGGSASAEIVQQIANFNTKAALPYSPDILAAWPAAIYTVSLAEASIQAHAQTREKAVKNAEIAVNVNDNMQQLAFTGGGITITSFKLLLLPVWISALELDGKSYQIALNGQTGSIAGRVGASDWRSKVGKVFSA